MNDYPVNWPEIAKQIKDAAGWTCVRCHSPHDPCNGRCLTVHHLDGNKANCETWNLAPLCQRCHLHVQAKVRMDQGYLPGIEHADWMRPFVEERERALTKLGD